MEGTLKTLDLIPARGTFDALVDRVHDGDTLTALLLVPVVIRMDGIQAAELSTEKGKVAAKTLSDRITKQLVTLELRGKEKFGRTLAKIRMADGRDAGEWLMSLGLAVPWDGRGVRPVGKEQPE